MENVKTLKFEDDGSIPNNPDLPLLVYNDALPQISDLVGACRNMFKSNQWDGIWVNGVYDYHHYHSTAHEALGVTGGSAKIQFGGEKGEVIEVKAGDVVVIPAGVGHCRIEASSGFQVVGAYPKGQNWDLRTGDPGDRPQVLENIQAVPLPDQDPVHGSNGPLLEHWS